MLEWVVLDRFQSSWNNIFDLQWKGFIELIDPNSVTCEIDRILQLEADMWAHWLQEYVQCMLCGNVDGKQDIYWKIDLPKEICKKTVSEIERHLWIINPCCSKCSWNTKHIFWDSAHRDDISTRYDFETSFLLVYRDIAWKIQGFMDWYVSDFPTIYNREFSHYYDHVWEWNVTKQMSIALWSNLPDNLLCVTALWVSQESASMFIIYSLMKRFFEVVRQFDASICGVYESVLGTNTHAIYEVCWGKRINASLWQAQENTHESLESDIFIHPNIWPNCQEVFWDSLRYFLSTQWRAIKEIVETHS